jgi:hypothetical protein
MRQGCFSLKSSFSGALLAGLLMVSGTGLSQQKTAVVPDAQIEANVLKALAGVPQLADQAIQTTTVFGEVTLSGTVRDEASRDMAEKVASDTPGVKKVIDQLAVGNVAAADNVQGPEQNSGQGPASDGGNPELQPNGSYAQNPTQDEEQAGEAPYSGPQPAPNQGPQMGQAGPPRPPQEWPNQAQGPYRRPYDRGYNQPPYGQAPPPPYQRPYPVQRGGEAVVVPAGTLIRVRVNEGMNSKSTALGTIFDGVVINDVIAGNAVAIPRGTAVQGRVVDAENAKALKGEGRLALQLTQITLGGQIYPVISDDWMHQGANKTGQTVGNAVGLGAFGAMIGAVAGGGPGALLGAGLGGVAGIGASAASKRGEAVVPAEAILTFHLTQPVPLTTVSQEEMNRLASTVQPMQRLQHRMPPPPPPYYYYGPAYYPY